MKMLLNLHLIKTEENKYRFSVLVNNVVFTDKKDYETKKEALEACSKLSDKLEDFALLTLEDIKKWEK